MKTEKVRKELRRGGIDPSGKRLGPRSVVDLHRKVSGCAYSVRLDALVPVKYWVLEKAKVVSSDILGRAIGHGKPLTLAQLQRVANFLDWKDQEVAEMRRLTDDPWNRKHVQVRAIEGFDAKNPVHLRINQLCEETGITVFNGVATFQKGRQVHLGPLYRYLASLQQSAEVPNPFIEGKTLMLDQMYVELEATEETRRDPSRGDDRSETAVNQTDPVREWNSVSRPRRVTLQMIVEKALSSPVVLFGDPGSGKSTLTHFTLHELGKGLLNGKGLAAGAILPFLIALRDFDAVARWIKFDIIDYLIRWVLGVRDKSCEAWRSFFQVLCMRGGKIRLLLLIDGVDEVTSKPDTFGQIRAQLSTLNRQASLIITSRRAGFEPPLDRFQAFHLTELADEDIQDFIRKWFKQSCSRNRNWQRCFEQWLFAESYRREMAGNLFLLSLLCFLHQDRAAEDLAHSRNRAELYMRAVDELVTDERLQGLKGVRSSLARLERFALDRYTNAAAGQGPSIVFHRDDVEGFVATEARSEESSRDELDRDLEEVWVKSHLVSQWNRNRWYHFLHRSFEEYFAAKGLLQSRPEVADRCLAQYRYNPHWNEVWRFYAGLCHARGADGEARFAVLAKSYSEPRDLFDRSLWSLAQMCAEYGMRDTRPLLGFDLRHELRDILGGRWLSRRSAILLVDLDPEFFFEVAKRTVENYEKESAVALPIGSVLVDSSVMLAAEMLQRFCSQEALHWFLRLLRAEIYGLRPLAALWLAFDDGSPMARVRELAQTLQRWLWEMPTLYRRQRLVEYLESLGSRDSSESILRVAREERYNKSDGWGDGGVSGTGFQLKCLEALLRLRDPRALGLANELWSDPAFRSTSMCLMTADSKELRAADVLERWMEDAANCLPECAEQAEIILLLLRRWRDRPVPTVVENLLFRKDAGPRLTAYAWDVVLQRQGENGVGRFRDYLQGLTSKRIMTTRDWEEVEWTAALIVRNAIPAFEELELFLSWAESGAQEQVKERMWFALARLHLAYMHEPVHREWLSNSWSQPVHRFFVFTPDNWGLFFTESRNPRLYNTSDQVFQFLSPVIEKMLDENADIPVCIMSHALEPEIQKNRRLSNRNELLSLYRSRPWAAPLQVVKDAFFSNERDLHRWACDILAEIDPSALMAVREDDSQADKALFDSGRFYFPTEYYCPKALKFLPYQIT